jgi:hypothetical protein
MRTLIVAIACATGLTGPALASERTMYVSGDGLNVRYCASGDCCIADRLTLNEPVSVIEEQDGWARISVYHDATFRNPSCTRPEEGLAAHWVSMTYLSDQVPDGADPNAWFGMLSDRRIRGVPRVGDYGLTRRDVETIRRYASRLLLDGTCEGIDAGNKSVVEDSTYYVACEGETEKRYFTARDAAS